MKNTIKIISFSLIIITVMLLVSCKSKTPETNGYTAKTVRINYTSTIASCAFQIMKSMNTLEKYLPSDVSVEWINIENAATHRDALVAGNIDVTTQPMPQVISAVENDMPIVFLSNSVVMTSKVYSNNPHIHSLNDILPNDKISISGIGNQHHISFQVMCKEIFGNADQFGLNLIRVDNTEVIAMLQSSNEIDCAIFGFPMTLTADSMDNLEVIADLSPTLLEYDMRNTYVTSKNFYEQNPAIISALHHAIKEAIDFINESPEEASTILANFYVDAEADDVEEYLRMYPPTFNISESAYNKLAKLMYELNILQNSPKMFAEFSNYDSVPRTE